jgi:hypothetical protein
VISQVLRERVFQNEFQWPVRSIEVKESVLDIGYSPLSFLRRDKRGFR